jgi:hypothetical protein
MRSTPWLFLALAACSSSPQPAPTDASDIEPRDAGDAPHDGAPQEHDAAAPDDGGQEHDAALPPPLNCRKAKLGVRVGTIGTDELAEASGIVESRAYPGVLWLHNDSGDNARLFVLASDGKALGEVEVEGADSNDWEDIAIGKGPEAGKSYLYIADIGDNDEKRERVQIYRVEEPALDEAGKPVSSKATAHRVNVTYAEGPHDAETLLLDPISGNLYIVAKGGLFNGLGQVPVFRIAAKDLEGTSATAIKVATVPLGPATGGDVLPDGSGIAIRNYTGVRYWAREAGESFDQALKRAPCTLPLSEGFGAQGEALGFTADGTAYLTTTEGAGSGIYRYDFE